MLANATMGCARKLTGEKVCVNNGQLAAMLPNAIFNITNFIIRLLIFYIYSTEIFRLQLKLAVFIFEPQLLTI